MANIDPRYRIQSATRPFGELHLGDLFMFCEGEIGVWRKMSASSGQDRQTQEMTQIKPGKLVTIMQVTEQQTKQNP